MRRRWLWVTGAFAVGLLVGLAAFYEGDLPSFDLSGLAPSAGGSGPVRLRVENIGTHDFEATLDVGPASGGNTWSGVLHVPAHSRAEHGFQAGELSGQNVAFGSFSWAGPASGATGTARIVFDAGQCSGSTLTVTFEVDSTNGIAQRSLKACG